MTAVGEAFIDGVRRHFAGLWREGGFIEVGAEDNLNYASIVVKNDRYYLRSTCDLGDRWIEVGLGKLAEGLVPPIPLDPPHHVDQVRELPSSIIVWMGTGDRELGFSLGIYDEDTSVSVDTATERMARVLGKHIRPLLLGDEAQWERGAELAVARVWRP